MTAMDRRPARRLIRSKLRAIRASLDQVKSPFLSASELASVRIRREAMCLEKKDSVLYFEPYTALMIKPEDEDFCFPQNDIDAFRLEYYLQTLFGHWILPDEDINPPGSSYTDFGFLNFGNLCDLNFNRIQWEVSAAWASSSPGLPHMKVLMYTSATVSEDQLFRGELLAIIDVMRGRLHTKSLRSSTIAPVLLFSVVGLHHVRVLEAFFQDEELVVRTTGLYDLSKQDDELLMRLSRWWLGHASGRSTEVD